MKRILLLLILFVSGCSLFIYSPTDIVKTYLDKLIELDLDLVSDLNNFVFEEEVSAEQQELYKSIINKQYENLEYNILEETIDDESALVNVSITVYDFKSGLDNADEYLYLEPDEFFDKNNEFILENYINYKLDLISSVEDRVTYEIEFILERNGREWIMNELSIEQKQKIQGIY